MLKPFTIEIPVSTHPQRPRTRERVFWNEEFISNWKFPDWHFFGGRTRQAWRDNSCRVQTYKKNSRCWLRTIIQSFLCAQSGASIRLTIWKWSVQILYLSALLPVLENFHRTFSPSLTDCPWVSEDGSHPTGYTVCPLVCQLWCLQF